MKKIYSLLASLLLTTGIFAQAPQKMSYLAAIHNKSGDLIVSQDIGMKVSVLQGGETGAVAYSETHASKTDTHGMINIQIGNGTVSTGIFKDINWANNSFFIKIEIDPTGGTNYTIAGTNELMSVPYALQATKADNGITSDQAADIILNTAKVTNTTHTGDVTGSNALTIGDKKVLARHLNSLNTPTNGDLLTYVGSTNDIQWSPSKITSMTEAQRDALTPVEGLIVYNNTTHQPNYYNGTEWMNYDGTSAE
jgi:hypothetical protein